MKLIKKKNSYLLRPVGSFFLRWSTSVGLFLSGSVQLPLTDPQNQREG